MAKKYTLTRITNAAQIEQLNLRQLSFPTLGNTSKMIRRDNLRYLDNSAFDLAQQIEADKKATHYMFSELFHQDICAFIFYGPRDENVISKKQSSSRKEKPAYPIFTNTHFVIYKRKNY